MIKTKHFCNNEEMVSQLTDILTELDDKLQVMEEVLSDYQGLQNAICVFDDHVQAFYETKPDQNNLIEMSNVSIFIILLYIILYALYKNDIFQFYHEFFFMEISCCS